MSCADYLEEMVYTFSGGQQYLRPSYITAANRFHATVATVATGYAQE